MSREESMRRHPAGRGRVEFLIADAQNQLWGDALYKLIGEADEFMGGRVVPESDEVRQARMDAEACEVGSLNAPPRPAPVHPVVGVLVAFVAGLVLYVAIFGVAYGFGRLGEWFGGWPL